MRSVVGALVLLTLSNVSQAEDAVVAYVQVLELSLTKLHELGLNDGLQPIEAKASAQGPWKFATLEPEAPFIQNLAKWKSQHAVRTLGSPTLQMISGTLATFRAGDHAPVPVPGSTNQGTANAQHLGLEVELLPKIEAAGTISADFHCRYTQALPDPTGRAKGVAIPALSKREVTTHCELTPGQTLLIRGLVQASQDSVRPRGLRRGRQFKPDERELIVLLRLELAAAANQGQAFRPAR